MNWRPHRDSVPLTRIARAALQTGRPMDMRPSVSEGFVPIGIRTRVLALKGPRPRPLDDGDLRMETIHHSTHKLSGPDARRQEASSSSGSDDRVVAHTRASESTRHAGNQVRLPPSAFPLRRERTRRLRSSPIANNRSSPSIHATLHDRNASLPFIIACTAHRDAPGVTSP